jgi:hypothetical protein
VEIAPGPPDLPPPAGDPVQATLNVVSIILGAAVVAAIVWVVAWLVGLDFTGDRRDGWYVVVSVVLVELAQTLNFRLRAPPRGRSGDTTPAER